MNYPQIDADSHVQETENSWETFLEDQYAKRRPRVLSNPFVPDRPQRDKTWYIDGNLMPKNQGQGAIVMSTPAEQRFAMSKPVRVVAQSFTDVTDRLTYMRRGGVNKSILFTTLFLAVLTDDLAYEHALMHSWNEWMAKQCGDSGGAFGFGALIPIRDVYLAVQEVRNAKKLGASAIMVLPSAGNRLLDDPIFDPVWDEIQRQELPVAVHIGWPNPQVTAQCFQPSSVFLGAFETSMWWAYYSFLCGGILDRFPKLKVGFFEHDARWFELFLARERHWRPTEAASPWPAKYSAQDYLESGRVYFSFEGDYQYLPRFLDVVGENHVMAALDFPHTHYGRAELSIALDLVRNHPVLASETKKKILYDNAKAFYGITDI